MKYILSVTLFLLSIVLFGQKKEFNREFYLSEKTPLFISYYGNLGIHPGIKGGFEYTLFFVEKNINKKKKSKTIRKNLLLAPSLTFYSHTNSHKGFIVSADLIWRRYTKRLFINDFSLGLGLFTKFNYGSTYEVTPTGVYEIKTASRSYFSPSIGYSFGKRISGIKNTPTDFFLRTNLNLLTNYNSGISIETSLELGVRMNLNFGFTNRKQN